MSAGAKIPRFDWEREILKRGPTNPTTRHVLLTLATHINIEGKAWPTTLTLTAETALTERSVCTHLEIAANEGWIERMASKGKGKAWKNYTYRLVIPPLGTELRSVANLGVRAESGAHAAEPNALATERDDSLALKDVQSNNVINTSYNNSDKNVENSILESKSEHSKTSEQTAQRLGISRQTEESEGEYQRRLMKAIVNDTASKKAIRQQS